MGADGLIDNEVVSPKVRLVAIRFFRPSLFSRSRHDIHISLDASRATTLNLLQNSTPVFAYQVFLTMGFAWPVAFKLAVGCGVERRPNTQKKGRTAWKS